MIKNPQEPVNAEEDVCQQARGSPDASLAPAPLQKLVELARGGREAAKGTEKTHAPAGQLRAPRDEVALVSEKLSAILKELERLKTSDQVLSDMNRRCQQLTEQFHEREVLGPLLLGLIGVADRCRQQIRWIKQSCGKGAETRDPGAEEALRQLVEARNADRIEVESILAQYGVETYRHPLNKFDGSLQKCVARSEARDGAVTGQIARRVLPGYRRNGRVIRPEYVDVYVSKTTEPKKGEQLCLDSITAQPVAK